MNTEIVEYLKKLSQKEFFFINLANSVLGILIIILGLVGLSDGMTMISYAFMFAAGAVMLFLNFYKGGRKGSRNKYVFLVSGIAFAILAGMFFVAAAR